MSLDAESECERLAALQGLGILDTPPETAFDELASLAAKICETPIALVSLVDEQRQWFKAKVGLQASQTPREIAFCSHALQRSDLLIVRDASLDERFCHNPLVVGAPHIRFYAGAPLRLANGHVLGTLCVIDQKPRDLTPLQVEALQVLARQVITQMELRRQAAELAEVSRAYQRMVDHSLDVICTINAESRFVYIGGACERMWGYRTEELMGRSYKELTHPDDLNRSRASAMAIRGGQSTRNFENRFIHKEGFLIHMMWSAVWSERDEVFYAVGRDIEALKVAASEIRQLNQELEQRIRERTADLDRANCELRLSTERYEAAVRGSNDGIWDWNLVTQEDYFSERWCELLGYSREELKPHVDTWIAHLHPEEKDWVLSQAHAHLEKRVPYDLECRLRTKTGEFRWFHARGQAVWNERGQAVRMAGSISDITTRREAEAERLEYQEQLRAMAAKLLQSEEAERHRIACDIHDQVGQTLAACRIQLGHCIAEPGDRAFKTRAQDVRVLLEQAIQETRSLTFDLSPPVLHELGLAAAIHWLADKHSVAGGLHVGCQIIDDVVLHPDLQVLLFRITRELVLNAVKHASATRVEIRMTNSEDCVRIEVADDGVGFDPESVRVTLGRRGGFGLFSARDRLRFVGGRLELDSRPGQGTHAVILVPEVKSTPIADSRKP